MNFSGPKVLVIHTAFIGDIILMTPLLRALRRGLQDSEIHALVTPASAGVLANSPDVDRVLIYDKRGRDAGWRGFFKMAKQLKREAYDLVICPHRSFRSAVLAWWTGASQRIGFHTSAASFLFNERILYRREVHEIDRNLAFAWTLGLPAPDRLPVVYPSAEDREKIDILFGDLGVDENSELVALAPGSIWATKRWPELYYRTLADRLVSSGSIVFLVGGTQDRELCQRIVGDRRESIINTAGELSITASAELLRRCRVLVSNDSAPMHLATAVGTPVVAIFGPTVPEFGFAPSGPEDQVVAADLDCRPCSLHGGRTCPIQTHECMISISPEKILDTIEPYLSDEQPWRTF